MPAFKDCPWEGKEGSDVRDTADEDKKCLTINLLRQDRGLLHRCSRSLADMAQWIVCQPANQGVNG